MLSSNRLVSAFKPWEPVCNDGHSVENAIEHGELGSVKCITEGIATVSLNFRDPIEETTSGIDEQTSIVTTSMKRTKLTSIGSNDKHLKPSKKSKVGVTSNDPSVSSVGKSKEVSNSQEANTSDQTFDNIENLPHGKKMLDKSRKGVELNRPLMNSNSARKNGKLTVDVGDVETLPQGGADDLTKETTPESAEKENGTRDLSIPVVIGLQCKSLTYSRTKKQQPDTPLAPEATADVEVAEVDTNSTTKRRRGRPRKLPLKTPETSSAVNHQNGDAFQDAAGFEEDSKMNASIGAESGKENPEVNLEKALSKSSGKALTVQHEKPKIVKGRRGKRRTISSINIEASPQDFQDSSKQKANEGLEKDGMPANIEKSFDTMSDDQPLSRWFEGMHSATTVDSTVTGQHRKVEQSSDASKKQLENLEISLAVANDDDEKLSFVKSSPLWETLESMEVFRMIPQNPHFRPLKSLKDSAREGQAISQMVNFSKVVENTSRLRSDGPRNAIEECLEVLVELEIHGFDVKLIRDRLTGLLLIKDKQEELEARWKEVEDKMERENVEGRKDDEEIQLLDKKIRELLERRSQVLSKKEKKGSEVGGLEAEIDGIQEGLNEIRCKFDGLAAASLCPP